MIYQGKHAESETFYGATPNESIKKAEAAAAARNLLTFETGQLPDGRYCTTAIFEKEPERQLLVEG